MGAIQLMVKLMFGHCIEQLLIVVRVALWMYGS